MIHERFLSWIMWIKWISIAMDNIGGYSSFVRKSRSRRKPYFLVHGREHDEQCRFFSMVRQVLHPANRLTFAVPNQAAGGRGPKLLYFVREGLLAGVVDVLCVYPDKEDRILGIEFKSMGKQLRSDQVEFRDHFVRAGQKHALVYSAEEAFSVWCVHVGLG